LLPLSTFINHFYPFQNYLSFPFPPPRALALSRGGRTRPAREREFDSNLSLPPSRALSLREIP
jgi:hypothetical protein